MNPEPQGTINGAWMPTVVFSSKTGITRDKLLAAFTLENIDARVFFWPLSGMDIFMPEKGNIIANDIPNRSINLPSYHDIKVEELNRVIEVITLMNIN
jgi:perosamine synthetase